ncbi:2120_t:CDS:2 [Diversispora eburnea]|uniref:2120_t:CDS:1 n=1 Tax=Diversispora eburnea TaxID=1213867 RepID=A0A9N9FNX4_9GLOM|nr:2120_t:CDS:2 [Diversispora eburnea]
MSNTSKHTLRRRKGSGGKEIEEKSDLQSNQQNLSQNRSFKSWAKKKLDEWDPSLKLKNTATNERTFLAWLRTSLSFISIGVAVTQLFRLTSGSDKSNGDKLGKPLGIAFIILGFVFLIFGICRYFRSQYLMTYGQFPASRGSVIIGFGFDLGTQRQKKVR